MAPVQVLQQQAGDEGLSVCWPCECCMLNPNSCGRADTVQREALCRLGAAPKGHDVDTQVRIGPKRSPCMSGALAATDTYCRGLQLKLAGTGCGVQPKLLPSESSCHCVGMGHWAPALAACVA